MVSENGKGYKNHLSSFKPLPDGVIRRREGVGHNSSIFVMPFASNSVIVKSLSHDKLYSFLLSPLFVFLFLHGLNGKSYLVWNYSPSPQNGKTELYLWEILGNLTVQDTWHQYKTVEPHLLLPVKSNLLKYGERLKICQKSCNCRNISIFRVTLHWGLSSFIPAQPDLIGAAIPQPKCSHNKGLPYKICI